MISVRNLTRNYGRIRAVKGVSLEIGKGEIVGLLGHNGAGKTTVMKVLTGFLEPSGGTCVVGGVDVVQDREAVQRQIGYLPENSPLYVEMTVQEYLLTMAELRGVPAQEREKAAADAAAATGLQARLVQPISTLSKGFRQRVGIAQAIVHKPAVLVLDEPTNGLDPVQIEEIRKLIRRLAERSTVILSTHILQEVEAVCKRVLVMIDGHLAADAPIEELLSSDVVRLSLRKGAKDVEDTLTQISEVSSATLINEDDEDEHWMIQVDKGAQVIPDIIALAVPQEWVVTAVARQRQTLQTVFHKLQQDYIRRQKGGKAA